MLLHSDLRDQVGLSGLQRVQTGIYFNRLKRLLTSYTAKQHDFGAQVITDSMNDLSKKVPSTLELAAVAGLSRVAPDEALAAAVKCSGDFIAFSSALKGFTLHGPDAEATLIRLDKELKENSRPGFRKP